MMTENQLSIFASVAPEPAPILELRDYQKQVIRALYVAIKSGKRRLLLYAPTGAGKTAIAFAAGVEQSKLLTKLFKEAGISCEHLEAKTPHDERKGMYQRLASGETRILSSVGTLTEGFDVPSISAIILARATKSKALLFQMCGRGLRLYPDKKDCFMLDFGENFKRLNYITTP